MKNFIDELAKSKKHLYDALPTDTEAQRKSKELQKLYARNIGKRALHIVKNDSRVVTIKEANKHFVRVSYKYFGMDYEGEINVTINYLSLVCGDDRLDIENG